MVQNFVNLKKIFYFKFAEDSEGELLPVLLGTQELGAMEVQPFGNELPKNENNPFDHENLISELQPVIPSLLDLFPDLPFILPGCFVRVPLDALNLGDGFLQRPEDQLLDVFLVEQRDNHDEGADGDDAYQIQNFLNHEKVQIVENRGALVFRGVDFGFEVLDLNLGIPVAFGLKYILLLELQFPILGDLQFNQLELVLVGGIVGKGGPELVRTRAVPVQI